MNLTPYKLGDICRMKYGKIPPSNVVADEGYPIFSGYRITGCAKEYLYDEPRVIVVARGVGGTGDVKMSPEKSWITNLSIVLDHDEGIVDKKFLLYRLGREPLKEKLNTGAAQAQITIDSLSAYSITLPPVEAQRRIACIITAYDDLIENNRRRIQLLEQAARLLYKEWFVHLRFPGHEHTQIIDGVPEGWEKKPLGAIAPLKYGKALKNDDRVPGPFPVYGSSGIVGTHTKALVPGPTIIVGRKGNVGSVYWSPDDCHPIDTVYYIDSELCSFFLYYALQQMTFISTDVAVPGLNRDFAHSRSILVADQKILRLFEETVSPLHQQMELLKRQNASLVKARDLLLPKLMNGEVVV
ncbi:restriction endonuclease subunit S [Desulfuromonas acetexigens]|uniref:Restriction endonuclease subunit S n=1 Tax=Trichloromonas acetexigens TaxID=38815 RepID=A0A550JHA3_9BACT|nr:restriction endonuclease subunit S [Desulfuromonas acetexigens]TRO82564.1 restriction endonuclease subunit S [Desulfuromonas acetexigens]